MIRLWSQVIGNGGKEGSENGNSQEVIHGVHPTKVSESVTGYEDYPVAW